MKTYDTLKGTYGLRPTTRYLLLLALLLTSCSGGGPEIGNGDVLNVFRGSAEWIIDGCLAGKCGTQMFVRDNLVVYARPFVDNVAFVVTSKGVPIDKITGFSGNLVNCETWAEFKAWLGDNGFQVVPAAAPLYAKLMQVGAQIASMELVPVFAIMASPPDQLPEWIVGERGDA